jgi:hypothetical protein
MPDVVRPVEIAVVRQNKARQRVGAAEMQMHDLADGVRPNELAQPLI